ncbi:hypothetical protein FZEAL_9250 [Fusarium zealandicum]|uniref:HIT domain-containing protein n=1 Tax=Fusarium zealandicum TaxID=1053134 RepID=A0A8H4UC74_9HYPO|nr:hypothetical protein FZEAL_9250 [Fusarium zealandicum]
MTGTRNRMADATGRIRDTSTEGSRLLAVDDPETPSRDDETSSSGGWDAFKDFEHLAWWRRPSVFWLLGPFVIFTLAFGGVIVPKINFCSPRCPPRILDLVCKQYFADQQIRNPDVVFNPVLQGSDNPQCKIPEVQRNVTTFLLVMNLVTGILSAVVAPRIGHLSDRYGRTRLMAVASVGGVLNEAITVLAARFPEVVNYRWLILGSVFDGMTGSFTAGNIMCQSYTSDCTPPSKRAVSMGYMYACLFSGLAFGPLLAGYFVQWTGSLLSIFYVVLGCHIVFILVVWLVIPESLSKRKQLIAREKWDKEQEMRPRGSSWYTTIRNANPFEPLKILWPTGPGTSPALRRNLVALAADDTIILGASMSAGAVIIIYSQSTFGWGNLESSKFVSALSMVRVFILMGVFPIINYFGRIRPAAKRRRESGVAAVDKNTGADNLDIWVLRVALMSDVAGSIGYILARNDAVFVGSGMITALGGLGSATSQAMISKHVPPERVGQLLGAIGMMHALARVLGPLLFNGLYAATVGFYPQAIFVLLACVFGVGLVASFLVRPHVVWEDKEEEEEEREPLNPGRDLFDASTDHLPIDEDQPESPILTASQVFLTTPHSFALVNLKPLIPGHVLVCPHSPHRRLTDLTPAETADLFTTVQLIQRLLARVYFPSPEPEAGSFSVAVQDGADAGQTVPHVHIHVVPRTPGDMGTPDAVYVKMASEDGNVGGALWDRERPRPAGGLRRVDDEDRKPRSNEEMVDEAERYKSILREMGVE